MFRSTGGNRRKRVTRRQCHAVNHHTCFGSAVPACCMKWHTGLALCQRCLVQCEPTEVEKWQAFESLCEKGFSFCGKLHFITNWPLNIKAWFFKLKKMQLLKAQSGLLQFVEILDQICLHVTIGPSALTGLHLWALWRGQLAVWQRNQWAYGAQTGE